MRVLVYGEIDLNLIDGSAIWLTSVAEVLALKADVEVLVLLRAKLKRDVVVEGIKGRSNIRLLDCWAGPSAVDGATIERPRGVRLDADEAAAAIAAVHRSRPLDVVLVRGLGTAEALVDQVDRGPRLWLYVTDPRQYVEPDAQARLTALASRVAGWVVQTEDAREVLAALLGEPGDRLLVLPPMIPGFAERARTAPNSDRAKLGYSGKLAPDYLPLETLAAFARIRRSAPGAEFHIVGDKIHKGPGLEGFESAVRDALTTSPGVFWHGGVSRARAAEILDGVDVAASWRSPALDDSLELSTKVLEYAALGIPILMNPSAVQRRVFGDSYPGYVTGIDDFVGAWQLLTSAPNRYRTVSAAVLDVAKRFVFSEAARALEPMLRARTRPRLARSRRLRLLVAGHDLRFVQPVVDRVEKSADYEVATDTYQGHQIADEARSQRLLAQADLVWCEWCLGNAVWYSRNLSARQRLVVRLHLQERDLPFLDQVEWRNVDRLVFIAPWVMEQCVSRRPHLASRSTLIYNPIAIDAFDRPKLEGAEFNLGMIGINPRRKAPHQALDLFERLRASDDRFTLFIKSVAPWTLSWLWRQADERNYYHELYRRIRESPHANAIVFDPAGPDVADWLATIGYILSPSQFEGSHQAVAEGMASGAVPIIWPWAGADRIYPPRFVVASAEQGADLVRATQRDSRRAEETACRQYARERFDADLVTGQVLQLFDEVLSQRPGAGAPARRTA